MSRIFLTTSSLTSLAPKALFKLAIEESSSASALSGPVASLGLQFLVVLSKPLDRGAVLKGFSCEYSSTSTVRKRTFYLQVFPVLATRAASSASAYMYARRG